MTSPPMTQITLTEAQQNLSELITGLPPGEEIQITQNNQTIACLIVGPKPKRQPRKPGSAIGRFTIVKDDDEHLKDFSDHMP